MNANDSLERGIADVYEREAPQRAPDWVLATALETIESPHSGACCFACRGGSLT
jgi:hypothetical protein